MPFSSALLLALQTLAIVALAWIPASTSSADHCPGLDIGISIKNDRVVVGGRARVLPAVKAGSVLKIAVTLTRTATTELRGLTLGVQLPDYLVVKDTATRPRLKNARELPRVEDLRNLYWTNLMIAPGATLQVHIDAFVPDCQISASDEAKLTLQASAYMMASIDTSSHDFVHHP
jgi:hypothetical protein